MHRAGRDTRPWGRIVSIASAGAAALHFAASGPHLMEYRPAGSFMIVSGIAQLITGLWMSRSRAAWLSELTLTLNAALIGLWAWTRIFGLPFGPKAGMREDIHSQDALAVMLELIICCAIIASNRLDVPEQVGRLLVRATAFGAVLVTAVAAHDPAREQLVGAAALLLAAAAHLCLQQVPFAHILRSIGRNDEEAKRDRSIPLPVRLVAGTRPGQR